MAPKERNLLENLSGPIKNPHSNTDISCNTSTIVHTYNIMSMLVIHRLETEISPGYFTQFALKHDEYRICSWENWFDTSDDLSVLSSMAMEIRKHGRISKGK